MKKKLLFSALCLSMLGFAASCNDDDETFKTEDYELDPSAKDITYGMNVVIMEGDEEIAAGIEVAIKGDVAAYNTNHDISYECVHEDGKTLLKPVIADGNKDFIIQDDVIFYVPEHKEINKKIKVIIRKEIPATGTNSISGVDSETAARFIDILGTGVDINQPLGKFKSHVLNSKYLAALNEALDESVYQLSTTSQVYKCITQEGSDFNSITKAWQLHVGVSGKIPIGKVLNIIPSIAYDRTESRRTENSYEYSNAIREGVMAEGYINEMALASYAKENNFANLWLPVISKSTNDALNNPGSAAYDLYPETEEGTFKLLDDLGAWFYTGCQLGGHYVYSFSKRMDLSEKSIMWGIGIDLKVKTPMGDCSDLGEYLQKKAASEVANINVDYKNHEEELHKSMECQSEEYYEGGAIGAKGWELTSDRNKWIPISYGTSADVALVNHGNPNPHLHELYELCSDPNSTRAQAIKRALTPDEEGLVPYIKHSNGYEKVRSNNMVLADVVLVEKVGGKGGAQKGDDQPMIMVTPSDGKTRVYYPLVANANQGFERLGFQPNINRYYFHGQSTVYDNSRHYIFYALDWDGPFVGMTNIRLGKSAQPGESTRGWYTDRGVKGDPDNGQHWIIAEWAGKDTPIKDKITGFGLKYTNWDNDNGKYKDLVFASTGGTEWDKKGLYRSGTEEEAYFNKYWGTKADYHRCEKDGGENQSSFCDIDGKSRPHTMHICYTKKPIERNMSGYGNEGTFAETLDKHVPICLPYHVGEVVNSICDTESIDGSKD